MGVTTLNKTIHPQRNGQCDSHKTRCPNKLRVNWGRILAFFPPGLRWDKQRWGRQLKA